MSSFSSESFYLAELGVEESKPVRPHPPVPLLPVAIGLMLGIVCDARWAPRAEMYLCGFIAAGLGMWACGRREWARWALLALAGWRRTWTTGVYNGSRAGGFSWHRSVSLELRT